MLALVLSLMASLAGNASYEEGLRLYKETEYEKAILRLEEVAVRPNLAPADKATVLLWLGLSYAGSGDVESAKRYLREALVADDTIALPPAMSPRIVAMFEEQQTSVAHEKAAAADEAAIAAAAAQAKQAEAAAHATSAPDAAKNGDKGTFVIIGGVAAGTGVAALLGAGVLGLVAADQLKKANDPNGFQDDQIAALGVANGAAGAASILVSLGVVLAGAGAAVVVLNLE